LTKEGEMIHPQEIADDLIWHLDEFHSLPEIWDNELDAQIHRWYAEAPTVYPKRPYFSPSSANACPKHLYYKQLRTPKDNERKQPHQTRWAAIGTRIGDMMQREILSMERNFEDNTGISPRFRFLRTKNGEPAFEEFIKLNRKVNHKGRTFYLFGTSDGIMEYRTPDGEKLRVGLELKSKQTTSARTSLYSMREPQEDHVKQCVAYSEMYKVDYFVILYVNASKKAWDYSEEDYEKTPDIRAFGIYVTDEDREELFDRFVGILDAVDRREPPKLDVNGWSFNPYKSTIAQEITEEEIKELRKEQLRVENSSLPKFVKRQYSEVLEYLDHSREAIY
jgi:hypothetical protein